MSVEDPDKQPPGPLQPTHLLTSPNEESSLRMRNIPESAKVPDPEDIWFLPALRG